MKTKLDPKLLAMSAACALVVNVMTMNPAHAQGMPESARELIGTMRPMPMPATTASTPADPNADAYGGMASGRSESARGANDTHCAATDSACAKPAQ